MLVLARRAGERIYIGDNIRITFVGFKGEYKIRLGIECPDEIKVWREELANKPQYFKDRDANPCKSNVTTVDSSIT